MGAGKKTSSKKRARYDAPKSVVQAIARAHNVPVPRQMYNSQDMGRCDVGLSLATVTNTPTFAVCNALQLGSGTWQRDGDMVKLKSFHIRGQIRPTDAAHATERPLGWRAMLVYDRQTNGATPSADALIYNVNEAGSQIATNSRSMTNYVHKKRFLILMDEYHVLPFAGSGGASASGVDVPDSISTIDRFIKLKNLPTLYSASANPATVAQVQTGGLFFVIWSDATVASWEFLGLGRLKFVRNC